MDAQQRLKAIAGTLLNPAAIPGEALDAAHRLTDLFAELGGFDDQAASHRDRQDSHTAHGKAISPLNAARCAWEYQRTAKFLQGVLAALKEAGQRFPGQRLEALYAGTGPYATLALPLLPFLSADDLGITFLDLRGDNLASVRHLLHAFGHADFALDFVEADATGYRHPRPLHMLISETMLNALQKEPQVAITLNLAPQLLPGGLLVPERIDVSACLADGGKEIAVYDEEGNLPPRRRVDLGRLLELSLDTAPILAAGFPEVRIEIPAAKPAEATDFLLLTRIATFGDIVLEDYECSLTCPARIRELQDMPGGKAFIFQYHIDQTPGFAWRPV